MNKHQFVLNTVIDLLAALRVHAETNGSAGLYDIASSVEVLVARITNIVNGLNLMSRNQIKVNFPAIDLADGSKRIAVQVTLNVTTEKWKQTVATFEKHDFRKVYDSLRIIGFCSSVKPRKLPSYVTVEGPEDLLGTIKTLETEDLEALEKLLRTNFDFSRFSPLTDEHCFGVVLSVVTRSAIRHMTPVEGDYDKMILGLNAVTDIITGGSLPDKSHYAKPLTKYSDPYKQLLRFIEERVSEITAEVNRSRVHGICDLGANGREKVDLLKMSIIDSVNTFCMEMNRSERIYPLR